MYLHTILVHTLIATSHSKVKYSSPVCLANSVEALWTPLIGRTASTGHLLESLWLGCGSNGVKVRIS